MEPGNNEVVINTLELNKFDIIFTSKPLVIGGLAMEYYGLRKRGQDIDLIIFNEDYQVMALKYPNNKKDIWGDLGITIHGYEIWRSISLLDYDFYSAEAIEYDNYKVVSFDKLFFMRAIAMSVEKYKNDFNLMIKRYYEKRNQEFSKNAFEHIEKYKSVSGGIVYNDEY